MMVVSGDLSSISGSFCIPTSRRQWVDSGSIWNRFGVDLGSWEGLGRVLGSFGVPLGAQDRISIDFRSILGSLLGPSRPQLGGLGASWGVLRRLVEVFGQSCALLFPILFPILVRTSFCIDAGPQNDAKIVKK